jgi:N-acetylglucosaminyldiphosphoundecaprenol N-acetyl-beta-D-mannosaminyltransferase
MSKINLPTIELLGIKINPITVNTLHETIAQIIHSGEKAIIANVNIHAYNLSYENSRFREFLNNAEIVFCDGEGVRFGGKLCGYDIPQRITYADWMWQLCEFAEIQNFSLFFLGSKPNIAAKAAEKLINQFPNLRILGVHHGYFDKRTNCKENNRIIELINNSKPDILVVGFGMPTQELWLDNNWQRIDAAIALTGGAVFDYISDTVPRAPGWMTNRGLEWLGRLAIEPKRLWKRYLLGNPKFFYRIMVNKIKE